MDAVKKAMKLQSNSKGKTAIINGVYLEGPFLNPLKCGALDASSFLAPDENMFRQLVDGYENIIKIVTVAPELDGSVELIKIISNMGIIVSMGHSDATYTEAEAGYNAGARGITHLFNAMRGIHHREPGLAGFGLMNKDIYVEVIADPFHLDQRIVDFIFNTKNADKIIVISDSIRDSMITGHSEEIRNESSNLMGGSMAVTEAINLLINRGLNKESVIKAVSENPETYLHINE
jgi:N-acetylglucosamine-6-phosphate deacetylase